MIGIGLIATMLTILFWSLAGIVVKKLSVMIGRYRAAIVVIGIGILPMIVILSVSHLPASIDFNGAVLAAFAGLFFAMGTVFVYSSLETEQVTTTMALAEMQPALLVLFSLFILGEHVNIIEIFSITGIFFGAFFVITTVRFQINKKLLPALFANLSFTVYWIILNYSIKGGGYLLTPLMLSRTTALLFVVAYLAVIPGLYKKEVAKTERQIIPKHLSALVVLLAVVSGLFDGSGDVAFGTVIQTNFLAFGSALSALTPMVIAILAYFIYKDRLTRVQLIGFMIMVASAFVLSTN